MIINATLAPAVYPTPIVSDPDAPVIMADSAPIKKGMADFHVVPNKGLWAVKAEHQQAYSGYYYTKTEALASAMYLARESAASVVIHGKNGRIQEVWNYANYPRFND